MSVKIREGFRVLVVEDEALISMLIEDMLSDIGCDCVDVASSVEGAIDALSKTEPHFAMLDVNLNGTRSFPVADVLKSRDIPFVFLSGYGARGLEQAYQGVKTLEKPFQINALETVIEDVLGPAVG
jgi:CheY-like chemotaxis protein